MKILSSLSEFIGPDIVTAISGSQQWEDYLPFDTYFRSIKPILTTFSENFWKVVKIGFFDRQLVSNCRQSSASYDCEIVATISALVNTKSEFKIFKNFPKKWLKLV